MAGLIQDRTVFQENAMRPCLRACSTALTGKATFASTNFKSTTSLRTVSGQASAKAAILTSRGSTAGPDLAAGAGAGVEATGCAPAVGTGSRVGNGAALTMGLAGGWVKDTGALLKGMAPGVGAGGTA